MGRISKTDYYFELAKVNSQRATCLRRRFGAIIIKDDVVVSMGYCGAPRGAKNCIDLEKCIREEQKVPSGERYELCRSVHAEMNAIINAATSGVNISEGELYLYGEDAKTGKLAPYEPCFLCKRDIINAKLKNVYVKTESGFNTFNVKNWIGEI